MFIVNLCIFMFTIYSFGNQLENYSFEKIGKENVPLKWEREYNSTLTAPLEISKDSYNGSNALCMLTEEWNYMRPQFVSQTVSLLKKASSCLLSLYAKGQGLIQLEIFFLKGNKIFKSEKQFRRIFGLEEEYRQYFLFAKIPNGVNAVKVRIGNSVDNLNRLNVWGKVLIDSVNLSFDEKNPNNDSPSYTIVDIAPYSNIYAIPVSFGIKKLLDNDIKTSYNCATGLERAGNINIIFPETLSISGIQLYLNGNVSLVSIKGDINGDGNFEKSLVTLKCESKEGWKFINFTSIKLKGIRIQAIEGKNLYSNYRGTNPFLNELKVFSHVDSVLLKKLKAKPIFTMGYPLENGITKLSYIPAFNLELPVLNKSRFKKRICADLWMWGVNASKVDSKVVDYTKNENFKKIAKDLKEMNVNSVMLDLTTSSVLNLMPWPTKVGRGTKENILKSIVKAIKGEGFEVLAELIHNISPFETSKWHYPGEETSRYPNMKQYPSIIYGKHFRDNWFTLLDEMMACGLDGVGLSTDEHQYKGHFMETFPKNDPAQKLYKKRFGRELPSSEEDSLAFRNWILMRHEGISDLFAYVGKKVKEKYPSAILSTMWMQPDAASSNITEIGIPWDIVAERGVITEMGSDYMGPWGIKLGSATNGWRGGTMVFSGNAVSIRCKDRYYYGSILRSWMYGSNGANYWRYNWIPQLGSEHALKNAFLMSDDLERLGAWEAKPPAKVLLLSSRSSVDWWQIKAWWGKNNPKKWDRGFEGQRGWYAERIGFNILQKNAYPFDWSFLDRVDQLQNLEKYKVILIPFAYSLSEKSANLLKKAVSNGTQMILLDGKIGNTDYLGERITPPYFTNLGGRKKLSVLNDDIMKWGDSDFYQNKVISLINKALGNERQLFFNKYGHDIEAGLLKKNNKEFFMFLINWENGKSDVDLGINLPKGKYELFMRDPFQWYKKPGFMSEVQLKKFRISSNPERPLFFYIRSEK